MTTTPTELLPCPIDEQAFWHATTAMVNWRSVNGTHWSLEALQVFLRAYLSEARTPSGNELVEALQAEISHAVKHKWDGAYITGMRDALVIVSRHTMGDASNRKTEEGNQQPIATSAESTPATSPASERPCEISVKIDSQEMDLLEWLKTNHPEVFEQQKHLDAGTSERAYWHFGRWSALKDVRKLKRETIDLSRERDLLYAATIALGEMCNTVSPRTSFTEAVDALDKAICRIIG